MSLLRERATEARVESTWSAFRPALARAWLWSCSSSASAVALYVLALHAATPPGTANTPTEVARKAAATSTERRPRGVRGWIGGVTT